MGLDDQIGEGYSQPNLTGRREEAWDYGDCVVLFQKGSSDELGKAASLCVGGIYLRLATRYFEQGCFQGLGDMTRNP